MKETKVAKEHLKKDTKSFWGWVCLEHKQTCQRWLRFLENLNYNFTEESKESLINKQLDLERAIKLYEDNGI